MAGQANERWRRICLVRLSALGDVCLLLPLVATLRRALPEARLTWVISPGTHALVEGLDGVEFVLVDKARPLTSYFRFYRRMRERQFDALLACQASFRAHWLYPAIHAPTKIGFDRQRQRDLHRWFINREIAPGRQHLLDGFLSFAETLGISERVIEWALPLGEADHRFAAEQLQSDDCFWLAVTPSASKPERDWRRERYAAVINHAIERWGWRVVLTGAPDAAARESAQAVLERVGRRDAVLNLVGRTTPKQLAAVLGRAKVLLAPDTGPVHIATAMGTPVVGLYAVVTSELSAPYRSRELVIDRFPDAVRKFLNQDPARAPWGTRVKDPRAMDLITVEAVLEKLDQVRVRQPARRDAAGRRA